MIDVGCSYLEGEDPPGYRPDIIRVVRSRQSCDGLGLSQAIKAPILIWNWLIGPAKIESEDFENVCEHFLVHSYKHQLDIRLAKGKRVIEIATNSATTFGMIKRLAALYELTEVGLQKDHEVD
ncbi:unnamed protein product [Cylicostephanus goldi]|uniref:Uncharacterized protein n=1 Tax=Cylicostephanus goldi TaxID=71465 RepID=A0A3P6RW70_CYLGO|nr:unnamed protein product [Cylicostephanus goldi]